MFYDLFIQISEKVNQNLKSITYIYGPLIVHFSPRNLNKLIIKHQSYSKSTKINAFKHKICMSLNNFTQPPIKIPPTLLFSASGSSLCLRIAEFSYQALIPVILPASRLHLSFSSHARGCYSKLEQRPLGRGEPSPPQLFMEQMGNILINFAYIN